ncbi:MAG TPA: ion transporter [Actinomycetales bacterium]|nr:ion transporter [Actinomycetales bacterium]
MPGTTVSTSAPPDGLDTTSADQDAPTARGRAAWRVRLDELLHSTFFTRTITALIVVNAALLGLETSRGLMATGAGPVIQVANTAILVVFVLEIAAKLVARGPRFFLSGWNVFDTLVVGIALVPAAQGLQVLRSLRVLRVLRMLSTIKNLRDIVEAIGRALSGMAWTSLLLLLVFYVFGVIGTELFRDAQPEFFGDLGRTMYTLFQVMTLESWSMGIARPTMETEPLAWVFFVPFILVSSFMVLNLFIAIIVNATQSVHEEEQQDVNALILSELMALREEVAELRDAREGTNATSDAPTDPSPPPGR